jgi:hypothetical protein
MAHQGRWRKFCLELFGIGTALFRRTSEFENHSYASLTDVQGVTVG